MTQPWERDWSQSESKAPWERDWSAGASTPPESAPGTQPIGGFDAASGRLGDFGRGMARGARNIVDAGAQLYTRGLESIAKSPTYQSMSLLSPEQAQGQADALTKERQKVEGINQTARQDYEQNWMKGHPERSAGGETVGSTLAGLPLAFALPGAGATGLMGQAANGALVGGATGALNPVDTQQNPDFWKAKGQQTKQGAAAGVVGAMAARGLSRLVSPQSSADVQQLIDNGVSPSPGQTLGGIWNRVEEKAQSFPFVGDAIRAGRSRAITQFQRGAINQALEPIGEELNAGTPIGHEAVDEAATKISDSYNRIVPQMRTRLDKQFLDSTSQLRDMAQEMGPGRAAQFDNILKRRVLDQIGADGTISGESFKEAETQLGWLSRNAGRSQDLDQQQLGSAIKQLQANLRSLAERSNPELAPQLQANNAAFARLARIQDATNRLGGKEAFTPSQLVAATKAGDYSARKNMFSRGNALMQDYAEAGKNVLGDKVPDSGTAGRLMLDTGIAGLLGGYGAAVDPMQAAIAGGAMGLGSLPYAPYVQGGLARLLAQRPELAQAIAPYIQQAAPIAAAAAPRLGMFGQ